MNLQTPEGRAALAQCYRATLLDDVIPFWLRQGWDRTYGGLLTALDRTGQCLDTDKSIWFQGRAAWMFATLAITVRPEAEWIALAQDCLAFLNRHGRDATGKLYFTVTREGHPLRMRRYVYSEAFSAIAHAAYARLTGSAAAADIARADYARYRRWSFEPNVMPAKVDPATRPTRSLGPLMIGLVTAQELRTHLGDDCRCGSTTYTQHIDDAIQQIETFFVKPEQQVVMETVGPRGEILDHFDGRLLNPGHAIECAWFILHEARIRGDSRLIRLGCTMLDLMWTRGWDHEYGGIYYYRDVYDRPIQEYWHDMKFWWPHCEAIIATALAFTLTGEARYATWHQQVHDWSFRQFSDPDFGEWFGYLHRDGRPSTHLKGSLWKGPFHLPRMLWYCWRLLDSPVGARDHALNHPPHHELAPSGSAQLDRRPQSRPESTGASQSSEPHHRNHERPSS